MKKQNIIVLVFVLASWSAGLCAQEQEDQTSEERPTSPPPVLDGQAPSLAFPSETVPTNHLSGGIGFTNAFTDNALLSNTNPVSDFSYLIQPYVSFSRATPRLDWDLNLGAGIIVHQHLPEENQFATSVALGLTYKLSPHLSLRASNTFSDTTGLFATLNPLQSGIGLVEQPNNSLLVPLVQRTITNASFAELSYHFSSKNLVGIRGSFSILDYPGASPNAQSAILYDTQTYSVEAFYNHWLSPRQWVGVALRVQRFDSSLVITDTSSLLLFYSVEPVKNLTVSFFAGPEYYNTPQVSNNLASLGLVQGHQWTSAEGATVGWQRARTSIIAAFSRQLSDGAGLYPAVILQAANAAFRYQLRRGLEVRLGVTYGQDDPLWSNSLASGYAFHSVAGRCELQQHFGGSFLLRLGYAREQQQWPGVQSAASANISWVSVSYGFSHLFGTGTSTKPAGRLIL
jgi:hypothetical protein